MSFTQQDDNDLADYVARADDVAPQQWLADHIRTHHNHVNHAPHPRSLTGAIR